jgi:hypothetical protein
VAVNGGAGHLTFQHTAWPVPLPENLAGAAAGELDETDRLMAIQTVDRLLETFLAVHARRAGKGVISLLRPAELLKGIQDEALSPSGRAQGFDSNAVPGQLAGIPVPDGKEKAASRVAGGIGGGRMTRVHQLAGEVQSRQGAGLGQDEAGPWCKPGSLDRGDAQGALRSCFERTAARAWC